VSEQPSPARFLDDLLADAAQSAGQRVAVRYGDQALTFADLNALATRWADILRTVIRPGAVVGVTNVLTPEFAAAYYAVSRAHGVVAIINPLLPAEGLAHVVGVSRAEVVIGTPEVCARVESVRDRLPDLRALALLAREPDQTLPTLDELATSLDDASRARADNAAGEERRDLDSVVCIQFTSGTTGPPKGVLLTHRNLTVNAAQVAQAHELGPDSITLNHLPTYHPMHMNSAVYAGATQVLCPQEDAVDAIALANATGATHFYSLPVRLGRLARDPRLPSLRLSTVIAILSGGSALPPNTGPVLEEQFGIPVIQGYGLAEMSPLTHSDGPHDYRRGSVGRALEGTECRIVDLTDGTVLPEGDRGEVQVRGPQRMLGYAGAPPLPADAWLETGDVGYLEDGRLFLVDRIRDVFKCDNWLVAPSEIEMVLSRHPAVADCVVVDLPDDLRGAVAAALVVLRPDSSSVSPDEIAAWTNAQLPYYQHLHRVAVVAAIPRSANGKVQRRDLRALIRAPDAVENPVP